VSKSKEVEEQQRSVHRGDPSEDLVVVHPDDAEDDETDNVGGIRGPDADQVSRELTGRRVGRSHLMMSSVIAIANTPSLKASSRLVGTAEILGPGDYRYRVAMGPPASFRRRPMTNARTEALSVAGNRTSRKGVAHPHHRPARAPRGRNVVMAPNRRA
jgi:hypothetical protein